MKRVFLSGLLLIAAILPGCGRGEKGEEPLLTIRAGHFPDIVHAQALVGKAKMHLKRG